MPGFKAGGGGYGLNKMSTLQFMDLPSVSMEIWHRNLRCEVPDCDERAITLAEHGVTMLLCMEHDESFRSDSRIALALTRAMRTWLQFHLADIARQAYEGQGDEIILVGAPQGLLDQARAIISSAGKMHTHNARVKAARNAAPIISLVLPAPTRVRPPISSLGSDNVHPGLQLFG